MRQFLIPAALVAVACVSVATPVAAQYPGPGYGAFGGGGIERELTEIRQQIHMGFDRGLLSRRDADHLTRDADRIEERLHHRAWNGLTFREREDLQRRIQALRDRLRFDRFENRH
ncbi:MAG TPA: hypothetical protein VH331_00465 [Allosphingosinicella sp.]|nr:hypothetical protein [Allosphingosinicella sp.]